MIASVAGTKLAFPTETIILCSCKFVVNKCYKRNLNLWFPTNRPHWSSLRALHTVSSLSWIYKFCELENNLIQLTQICSSRNLKSSDYQLAIKEMVKRIPCCFFCVEGVWSCSNFHILHFYKCFFLLWVTWDFFSYQPLPLPSQSSEDLKRKEKKGKKKAK